MRTEKSRESSCSIRKSPVFPGDPGHAQTFSFPVLHGIVVGLPFQDLVDANTDRVELAVETARKLESRGVSFVAADCGLFSVFQDQIARAISIPFIGSSLSLIPFLCSFLSPSFGIGVLTGDTGMLSELHLRAAGADPSRTLAIGMENSAEFKRVVIDRGEALDEPALAHDVRTAATALAARARSDGRRLGVVVIECTNFIPLSVGSPGMRRGPRLRPCQSDRALRGRVRASPLRGDPQIFPKSAVARSCGDSKGGRNGS